MHGIGNDPVLTLIREARLFTPDDAGMGDILLAGNQIAALDRRIEQPVGIPVRVVEAGGQVVTPGLIDIHVHITGGGGEGGPATRVPEIRLAEILEAGVTTVAGLLGTDDVSRTPAGLLAKALGLEQDGLSTAIFSGSYAFPPVQSITGSLKKDLMLIPHVVGVGELAISDHRSAQPSFEDLARVAAEARVGGMLGNKAGLVNLHMGEGRQGLEPLVRLVRETDIPVTQLLPTHINRSRDLFSQGIDFARMGGFIDLTAFPFDRPNPPITLGQAIEEIYASGVSLKQVTFSSDANGSLPQFDDKGLYTGMGVGRISVLLQVLRELVQRQGFPAADILACLTANPAARLKWSNRKGRLAPGMDADIVLFDPDWNIGQVYCRGKLLVDAGRCVAPESIRL